MDKEIEEILKEIEHFLATARNAEREYRELSPDEREQIPKQVPNLFDSMSG